MTTKILLNLLGLLLLLITCMREIEHKNKLRRVIVNLLLEEIHIRCTMCNGVVMFKNTVPTTFAPLRFAP